MNSLVFKLRKTLKNRLLQLRRKPGLLVLYLLFAGLITMSFIGASSGHMALGGNTDIGWLKLAFLAYLLLFAFTSVTAGLSTGASVFAMADVNFLFTAPVSPKLVLVDGLLQQAGKSIFASVFILMMGSTLRSVWGVGPTWLLALFVGYVFSLVVFQLVSVVIYMYANGRPGAKRVVAVVAAALLLPTVLAILVPYLGGVPIADALLAALHGNILYTLPVAGWVTQGVFGLLSGNFVAAGLGLGLSMLGVALCFVLLLAGKSDYYEDVLVATETTFQRQRAAAEGNLQAAETRRKVKLGKNESGKIWGWGASAFLGKHMLEDFRRNRLKLLDASSFSFILTAAAMAFFLRQEGGLITILITTMMMRMFLVGTGLGLKELYTHYIFMVPASSFAKIVWSNLELCIKSLAESVIAFVAAGLIMGASAVEILLCVVVTAVFTVLLVSVNLLSMRMFASVLSQGLLLTFYMLFVLLVMAPGIVGAVLLGMVVGGLGGLAAGLGVLTLWQLLLSALFFFLARGVLHNCDMETAAKPTR
ncbi:putative ABC exporter domain-containing protein [Ruminococcaceae bacterium OttesenSCG-928-O06]|nr:putative ABC exporter domain-containing protein [Ruminococcaceae bacterium OttesenSCG-928-O06]